MERRSPADLHLQGNEMGVRRGCGRPGHCQLSGVPQPPCRPIWTACERALRPASGARWRLVPPTLERPRPL
eukprot:7879793-Alexandrium_andersonii.AAC.1